MGFALVEVRQPARKPVVVAVRDALEIGRDCDGFLLVDSEVSRRHLVLELGNDGLTVNDLGSTNGTTVNGVAVHDPTPVGAADVVRLGNTELQLLRQAEPAEGADVGRLTTVSTGAGAPRGTVLSGAGDAVVKGRADDTAARRTSIDAVVAAVDEDHPDVAKLAGAGGTITIAFSDIEASTELAVRLGDAKWVGVLRSHHDIVRRNLARYDGTEVSCQGDGFMLTFPSARAGVQFAIDVQREFATYEAEHPETPIRVRIGLHTGEPVVDARGDMFGQQIVVAARIADLADGGQVLVSAITKEITSSRGDLRFGKPREVSLKGIEGTHQVHELLWNEFAAEAG